MLILKNFKNIFVTLFLFSLALVPLLAFKDGYLIGASEHQTWLKSDYVLDDFSSLWSNRFNSLSLDSTQFFRFFSLKVANFFYPDDQFNNQKLILLSFSFLQPFAIYFLFINFFRNIEFKVLGGLSASLFYTFNLFYLIHINLMLHHVNLILSFTPLILVFLLRLINTNLYWRDYKSFMYSFLISLCLLPLASSANNPPNLFSVIILGLIFLIFYFSKDKNCFYKILILFFIILLINAFWIFNAFVYWTSIFNFYITEYTDQDFTNLVHWNLVDKYYLNEFFRLSGLPAFESYWFFKYFENITIIAFFSHLSAFICFFGIFVTDKVNKSQKKLLYLTLLIFLFLIKGINPPLGIYFREIFDNLNFMYMFRNPAAKFGNAYIILLSLAYGYSIVKIYQTLKFTSYFKIFFISTIIISTTILVGFPRLIDDKTILLDNSDHHIKIPNYWYDLDNWLDDNNFTDSKMILLPESDRSTMYELDNDLSVMSQPIAYQLLPNKLLWRKDFDYNYDQSQVNLTINNIEDHMMLKKFLDDRNIQFILLQGDVLTNHYRYDDLFIRSSNWHENNLDKSNLFTKKKFGKLTLFINKNYTNQTEFNFFDAIKPPKINLDTDNYKITNNLIKNLNDDVARDIFNILSEQNWELSNNNSSYKSQYLGRNTYKIIPNDNQVNQMISFEANYNKNWILYFSKNNNLTLIDRLKILFGKNALNSFIYNDKATWHLDNLKKEKNYFVVFKFQYVFELLIQLSIYISSILMIGVTFFYIKNTIRKNDTN